MSAPPEAPAAAPAPATHPTDSLSILALAAGIAALVLALVSLLPLVGMCTGPLSALAALTGLVSGAASVVRTTVNRELDGRQQAFAGLFFSLVWCGVATVLALYVMRAH